MRLGWLPILAATACAGSSGNHSAGDAAMAPDTGLDGADGGADSGADGGDRRDGSVLDQALDRAPDQAPDQALDQASAPDRPELPLCGAGVRSGIVCPIGQPFPCRLANGDMCQCNTPCSGVPMPASVTCFPPPPPPPPTKCPMTVPMAGTPCPEDGLVCPYGNCGGYVASCVRGQWKVEVVPPPP